MTEYPRTFLAESAPPEIVALVQRLVPLLVSPPSFAGGNVAIELEGVEMGAGCVLFVRDGCLADLEGYTYGTEPWPEHVVVRALGAAEPIGPPEPGVRR